MNVNRIATTVIDNNTGRKKKDRAATASRDGSTTSTVAARMCAMNTWNSTDTRAYRTLFVNAVQTIGSAISCR